MSSRSRTALKHPIADLYHVYQTAAVLEGLLLVYIRVRVEVEVKVRVGVRIRIRVYVYQTATVLANWLFLVNFAVNFVLYCVVNVRFRRTARDLLCCAAASAPTADRRLTTASRDRVSMISR